MTGNVTAECYPQEVALLSASKIEFVYVLRNDAMPGIVKVGRSAWLPEDRAKALSSPTGVALPFEVSYRSATSSSVAVERLAHELLKPHRINPNREFFRVSEETAIEAVRNAAIEAGGIDSLPSGRVGLNAGDRLAFSLEAGQIFVLIRFTSLFAASAEIIDLWQAHSDGDLLELLATKSAAHVAGLSDNDPGATDDPVPYLDRASTVANGMINGRERLVPGDRLLWLAADDSGQNHSVLFEANDYCQVVSRTWSPRVNLMGQPLLLNDYVIDGRASEATRESVRQVLAMPLPRNWAPASPGDRDGWEIPGSDLQGPVYWLPQLKPRSRKTRKQQGQQ
jgi:T5orf172 domain-containing protein